MGDDWPWWHWDPGGLFDDRYNERSFWDPDIEGSVPGDLTQEHSSTHGFVCDPGIASQLHRANRVAHIFGLLEGKQSWGGRSVIFLFFGVTYDRVRMDFQSWEQTGHRYRLVSSMGPGAFWRSFEEFLCGRVAFA